MHAWSKYKDYLLTSFKTASSDIKVVYHIPTKKSFFCFDDMMASIGYKTDDNGAVLRSSSKRYVERLNLVKFMELFPFSLFVSVDKIKNFPSLLSLISNSPKQTSEMSSVISCVLRSFVTAIKDRKEIILEDDLEDIIEVNTKPFAVATYNGMLVVKATDVIRYCGYKTVKVRENFLEHSVKIKTKNGIANFIPVDSFPIIANEMNTPKYSTKMVSLFNGFLKKMPAKKTKAFVDKEKSVIIIGTTVIPFIQSDDVNLFQTSVIQKFCGYTNDSILDNFKNVSTKINDYYYMSIDSIKDLINSRMTSERKSNLKDIANYLYKFS